MFQSLFKKDTKKIPHISLEKLSELDFNTFEVLKIKGVKFPIKKLRASLNTVEKSHPLIDKDNNPNYQSVALQYSYESDPIYDANEAISTFRKNEIRISNRKLWLFSKKNELAKHFDYVFEKFEPYFGLTRGRLLRLKKHSHIDTHSDGIGQIRLHIPIHSSRGNFCRFQDNKYFMKPDGSAYLFNASVFHDCKNESDAERDHLVFTVMLNLKAWKAQQRADNELTDIEKNQLAHMVFDLIFNPDSYCARCSRRDSLVAVFKDKSKHWSQLVYPDNIMVLCSFCRTDFFDRYGFDHYRSHDTDFLRK